MKRKNKKYRIFEKELIVDKIRDHCHLTDKNRGPAHYKKSLHVTHE